LDCGAGAQAGLEAAADKGAARRGELFGAGSCWSSPRAPPWGFASPCSTWTTAVKMRELSSPLRPLLMLGAKNMQPVEDFRCGARDPGRHRSEPTTSTARRLRVYSTSGNGTRASPGLATLSPSVGRPRVFFLQIRSSIDALCRRAVHALRRLNRYAVGPADVVRRNHRSDGALSPCDRTG
jgi:hypothetical protein